MLIFDSAILDFASRRNFRGIQKVEVSQRKLNCALFVKDSLIKNFLEARKSGGNLNLQDRTNLDSALTSRFQVRMVRISVRQVPDSTNFVLGGDVGGYKPPLLEPGAPNFYGEFDSGSERTLAAWIRHASRTGLLLVAIPKVIQWRTGA
jgi:hypothetical protein